jgi:hypothetical protein
MRVYLPLLLALLAACESSPSTTVSSSPPVTSSTNAPAAPAAAPDTLPPPDTTRAAAANATADTLRVLRRRHAFSQPGGKPDEFRLVFRGASLLTGAATFTITDPSGQVIFREMLPAADLEAALVYEMKTPSATAAEREAFIRRRLDEFLLPAHFHSPAIAATAAFPAASEQLDRATWTALRQAPQSIRFDYLVGKEDRRQIAWSPLKKQVVRLQ